MADNTKTPFFVVIMAVVAAMGGLLFGFDTGVISGAIPFLQQDFSLTDGTIEFITTAGLIGAIIGALIGGSITDGLGRRKVLILSGIIFGAGALWSGMIFMPESPRWLLAGGKDAEAMKVLSRTEGDGADDVASSIRNEIAKDRQNTSSWADLFRKEWKYPLIIAVGIMFIQQFVGINTVMYYSPKIFQMAGFDGSVAAIGASIGVGVINVVATLLSVYFVDRIGRRRLFFIGMAGMVISLSLLAGSFIMDFGEAGKFITVGFTLLYVTFYAVSVGPLGWLIISEVFPQKLRGKGSSIGSLAVWVFNSIVTFTFFKIANLLSIPGTEVTVAGETMANPAGSFLFYALIALLGMVWGWFFMPETKDKSLESIEQHWRDGGTPKQLKQIK